MRITKIMLAGFKSFVDPTTLPLPANLTCLVGPNGCGKSNIIDAVVWVMGESSAKHLRGESMVDVIFNGSNSRKPVGQASVELIFDNSDGGLGGQYAGYGEIAIKRTVSRDGVSAYMLNGARCRRKDVVDVFLGTGLGARGGYSVIEQGMISRVVEAKPEELRGFLEEAAGISKYKERRRETENRIRHTKENLERLADIREELANQLAHLQRQANAAKRYQTLKQDERQLHAQLVAIRWRGIDGRRRSHDAVIHQHQTNVDAAMTTLHGFENQLVQMRDSHTRSTDLFNQVQSDFYAKSAEISRLENTLEHSRERRGELEQELQRCRAQLDEVEQVFTTDSQRIEDVNRQVREFEPTASANDSAEDETNRRLKATEAAAERWQFEWDEFNHKRTDVARQEHAEEVRLEHLRDGFSGAQSKIDDLRDEHDGVNTADLELRVDGTRRELMEFEQRHDRLLSKRDEIRERLQEWRSTSEQIADELHEARSILETINGRQASLQALQGAALGRDQVALHEWLAKQGLDDKKLLLDEATIEPGWEAAVEAALKIPLGSICHARGVEVLATAATSRPPQVVTVLDDSPVAAATYSDLGPTLISKVTSRWDLSAVLGDIFIVENRADALAMRSRLMPQQSVVSRDGLWLGPNWIQIIEEADHEAGILERRMEIEALDTQRRDSEGRIADIQQTVDAARASVSESEERELENRDALEETIAQTGETRARLSKQESELERARERVTTLTAQLGDLEQRSSADESAISLSSESLQQARRRLAELERERQTLLGYRSQIQQDVDRARLAWREAREASHEIALKLENLKSSKESLVIAIERNRFQFQQLSERRTDLESAIVSAEQPQEQIKQQLERALAYRIDLEQRLNAARVGLEDLDTRLKETDHQRAQAEQSVAARRDGLEQARLEERTIQVQLQELENQIGETEFELPGLLEDIEADAAEEVWLDKLEAIRNRINRLGPINLAAIDEHSQLSERKDYLDRQHADLTEALDTLEGAIHKIDRETRTRFKETFDKVNAELQTVFPVLFGGGHAYLELTGDDLLETGVTVMARPPGKRNSTIHLLSGGEKALTALAFVFALFELNPAPFCLLDEVDAPLDDTNVVRLSEMLQSMSQRVQFICVTHNKITMEIAAQLIGVTMEEAGVSRLVSVDMEEAVEMAATG